MDEVASDSSTDNIKKMPKFDPDASITELYLTIPSWISSIRRTRDNTDFSIITDNAKGKLTHEIGLLIGASKEILIILEADDE